MSKAALWNIKGVDNQAREAAREAARRSGLTVGEWLNDVIAEHASQIGVEPEEVDADSRLEAVAARLAKMTNAYSEGGSASLRATDYATYASRHSEREQVRDDGRDVRITQDGKPHRNATASARTAHKYTRSDNPFSTLQRSDKAEMRRRDDHSSSGASTNDRQEGREVPFHPPRDRPPGVDRPRAKSFTPDYEPDDAPKRDALNAPKREAWKMPPQAAYKTETRPQPTPQRARPLDRDDGYEQAHDSGYASGRDEEDFFGIEALREQNRERDMLQYLSSHVETIQQRAVDRQNRVTRETRQGFDVLKHRLDSIEKNIARRPQETDVSMRHALTRLEERLDHMASQYSRLPHETDEVLQEVNAKIERLSERLLHARDNDLEVAQLAKIEEKIDRLEAQLQKSAAAPQSRAAVGAGASRSLSQSIGEGARRLRQLDQRAFEQDSAPVSGRTSAEASRYSNAPFGAQAESRRSSRSSSNEDLDQRLRRITARLESANRGEKGIEAEGSSALLLDLRSDVGSLGRRIEDLSREMERISQRARPAETASSDQEATNTARIESFAAQLRLDMAALSKSLSDVAPRQAVSALEASMRDLTQRIEVSRTAGAQESLLQPVEKMAHELQQALREADPRPTFEVLKRELSSLNQRIEILSSKNAEPVQIEGLQRQMQEIRDLVRGMGERASSVDKIEHQIEALSASIEEISTPILLAASKPQSAVLPDIASIVDAAMPKKAIDSIEQRLGLLDDKINEAIQSASGGAHLADLSMRMEEVQRTLDRAPSGSLDLRALENILLEVSQKLETERQRDRLTPAITGLEHHLVDIAQRLQQTDRGVVNLSERMADVHERMAERLAVSEAAAQPGNTDALQNLLHVLSEKMETAREPQAATEALQSLETQLLRISDRLDRSDRGMGQLEASANSHFETLSKRIDVVQATVAEQLDHIRQGQQMPVSQLTMIEGMVKTLADKVDAVNVPNPSEQAIGALERQISQISERLEKISSPANQDMSVLENSVQSLADKLQMAMAPNASVEALEALEAQVIRLSQKLDSEPPANRPELGMLERSINELLTQVEDSKQLTTRAAEEAARLAVMETLRSQSSSGPEIGREIEHLRSLQEEADLSTRSTLNAVHSTLEKIVNRLCDLEQNTQQANQPFEERAGEFEPALSQAAFHQPEPYAHNSHQPTDKPASHLAESYLSEPHPDISSDDDDFLIEPKAASNNADPIHLAAARRSAADSDEVPGRNQQSFIEAARRAAQAAHAESISNATADLSATRHGRASMGATPSKSTSTGSSPVDRIRAYVMLRAKPLLLGLAAAVILIGATGIVMRMDRGAKEVASQPEKTTESLARPIEPSQPIETSASKPTESVASPVQPSAPTPTPAANEGGKGGKPDKSAALSGNRVVALPGSASVAAAGFGANGVDTSPVASISRPALPNGKPAEDQRIIQVLANNGNAAAQYELAMRQLDAPAGQRDTPQAISWLDKAAAQGLVPAQYQLGVLYEAGQGVPMDLVKARTYYRLAAEKGNVRAMHNLAVMTARSSDVKPDYANAAIWFGKAANYGIKDSQFNLAVLNTRGFGVPQNLTTAYVWFSIVANQGDADAAAKRDEIKSRLDNKQLASAQEQIKAYRPAVPDPSVNVVDPPIGGWESLAQNDAKTRAQAHKMAP